MINFFEDSYKKEGLLLNDLKKAKFVNVYKNKKNIRKIIVNGTEYPYKDADGQSTKLYESLRAVYETKFKKIGIEIESCDNYEIKLSNGIRLKSDYLGPSTTTAYHIKYDSQKTLDNIISCRILGGHILWPLTLAVTDIDGKIRNDFTINCKRAATGSRGIGISDRIDITLYEIKRYLNKENTKKCYNVQLANLLKGEIPKLNKEDCRKIKEINDKFFEMFNNDFKMFCDFFGLVDSFVDKNYNIINFLDMKRKKITIEDYEEYVKNNINAINKRQIKNNWI